MPEAILWAVIVGIPAALIAAFILERLDTRFGRWWKSLRDRWRQWLTVRQAGLWALISRRDPFAQELVSDMLKSAKKGDDVLLVGRTHAGILKSDRQGYVDALERGVNFTFVVLDSRAIKNLGPALRILQIQDAHTLLARDLGATEAHLLWIRQECERRLVAGQLLVYRTDQLIQNSAVIHKPLDDSKPMRLHYDFSFGQERSEKFIQCYKTTQARQNSFCACLTDSCQRLIESDACVLDYNLSYRKHSNRSRAEELEHIAKERMQSFTQKHGEAEPIRANALAQIIPAAAKVFQTLAEQQPAPAPVSVQIELTNICSTTCRHCLRWNSPRTAEMSTSLARDILDQLSGLGVQTVTLSGGEPTTHSDFSGILRYAHQKHLAIGVLSNGVGLSSDTVRDICYNANWLRLSIDGSNAAVYGRVRRLSNSARRDAFHQIEDTLERYKHWYGASASCRLAICYTIQRNNADDLESMIDWVNRLGLPKGHKCLIFKFAHGTNGFLCTPEQLERLQLVLEKGAADDLANLKYVKWFLETQSGVSDIVGGHPTENLYRQQDTRCFTPNLFSLVDPEGSVYPCCFLFNDNGGYGEEDLAARERHLMGDLKRQTFAEIWRGDAYQRMRDEVAVIRPTGKYDECRECTRHCNHNRWLSRLYQEYKSVREAEGDADKVMASIAAGNSSIPVWL